MVCDQLLKEDCERNLAKDSFTSDSQIYNELDAIAETTRAESHHRNDIIQFLRSKHWLIEELENVHDMKQTADRQSPTSLPGPTRPHSHIFSTPRQKTVKRWWHKKIMMMMMMTKMMTTNRQLPQIGQPTSAEETSRQSVRLEERRTE